MTIFGASSEGSGGSSPGGSSPGGSSPGGSSPGGSGGEINSSNSSNNSQQRSHGLLSNMYFNISSVLIVTISAGSILMGLSIVLPTVTGAEQSLSQQVLPYATGLIGFASGLVASLW